MLRREHGIADYEHGRIVPDRLGQQEHAHYIRYAERMLTLYRLGVGRTRRELHQDVHHIFAAEADCPIRRIDAFCKLLDDVSEWDQDRRGKAAALRKTVFRAAAPLHPLVAVPDSLFDHEVTEAQRMLAERIRRPWAEIDSELFADVIEFHRLQSFAGYPDGRALLARYNVAQVQVALFDAISMTVWASQDFKTILRYAKLARLMHTICRRGPGQYEIRFDGPSSVLHETRRYGTALARFLPALLACRGWKMHTVLKTRRAGWKVALDLSPADRLNSHLPEPSEFDSDVESAFAAKWGPDKREGWRLDREGEILHEGQRVFIPDFVFRHDNGRTVLMEIIGFWTPEYLQAKCETLGLFRHRPILLAVAAQSGTQVPELAARAIQFKSALRLNDVLERLRAP